MSICSFISFHAGRVSHRNEELKGITVSETMSHSRLAFGQEHTGKNQIKAFSVKNIDAV